jgi:hypothetical protein
MSVILESAKSHFRDKLSGGLRSLEVPEWSVEGKPAVIHYKPSLNFSQQEKILSLSDQGKKAEAIVEALIQRALDEDGNRLFKAVDRTELMKHTDPEIISRIVGAMAGDEDDLDEASKN